MLHAAGKLGGAAVGEFAKAHEVKHLFAAGQIVGRGNAVDLGEKAEIFGNSEVAVEAETLGQVAELFAGAVNVAQEVVAGDGSPAAVWAEGADEEAEGGFG